MQKPKPTLRELFSQYRRGELTHSELHARIARLLDPQENEVTQTPASMASQIRVMEALRSK